MRMRNKENCFTEHFPFNQIKRSIIGPVLQNSSNPGLRTGFHGVYGERGGMAAETVVLREENEYDPVRGMLAVMNKLYALGYEPTDFLLDIIADVDIEEVVIRNVLKLMSNISLKYNCSLSVGNAGKIAGKNKEMIVSIFATGNRLKDIRLIPFNKKAKVLFVDYLAKEETAVLARTNKEFLLSRLPFRTVYSAMNPDGELCIKKTAELLFRKGVMKIISLGSSGFLEILYELTEDADCGIRVDMESIPIHQESIEVCELLKRNPYELYSNGTMLVLTDEAEEIRDFLAEHNIPAQIIASLDGRRKAKELVWKDRVRYLDRP